MSSCMCRTDGGMYSLHGLVGQLIAIAIAIVGERDVLEADGATS